MHARPTSHLRRILAVAVVAVATLTMADTTAVAEPRITVSPDSDLDPTGHEVTVRGEGYDEFKGIYVAWCVVPPAGEKPSPCGGGEDRDGSSGNSRWIVNPLYAPAYAGGLAESYDGDGGFETTIVVSRHIGTGAEQIDCFEVACAVVTRNDHERSDDRSQDAFAPVTFAGQPGPAAPADTATASEAPEDGTAATAPSATASASPEPAPTTAPAATPTPTPTPTLAATPASRPSTQSPSPSAAATPLPTREDLDEDDLVVATEEAEDEGPGARMVGFALAVLLCAVAATVVVRRNRA